MALSPTGSRGAVSGGLALVETITLAAPAAAITFSTLPSSGYTHLLIVGSIRSARAAVADTLMLRFNGDTTAANYVYETLLAAGSGTPTAAEGLAAGFIQVGHVPAASGLADHFGALAVTIPDYLAVKRKTVVSEILDAYNTTTGTINAGTMGGAWISNAAPTSIALLSGTGATNLTALSRASLYVL